MPGQLIRRKVVDSTNDEAKALIAEGAEPWTVVVAERQVAGKGRYGRSWASPPGGLYLSVILREALERSAILSMAASLSVVKAIEIWDLPVAMKWPNDVQVDREKVAGILVEGLVGPEDYWAVVGVGVNSDVPLDRLPKRLDMPATTLRHALRDRVDNEDLLARILATFRRLVQGSRDSTDVVQAYRARCDTLGREVQVTTKEGVVQGKAVAIRASGALVIQRPSGEEVEVADGTVREPT